MEQAATLIAEMKTMAAGNATAMAMLEKKQFEFFSIKKTTPKELIELIAVLKKELAGKKQEDLNYDFFEKVEGTIAEIEIKFSFLKEEEKEEVKKEIDILYISVSKLDDFFVRNSISVIKSILEKDKDYTENTQKEVEKEVEKVEEGLESIKNLFLHFEGKGNFSVDKKWNDFKATLDEKKTSSRIDLGESKTIDFDLRVLHYKGKLHFDKKEDLISEIEKEVGQEFTEVIDGISDVRNFAKEWKTSVDKKLAKKIEKIFKKEDKKEKREYLITLPIVFKKVSEDGSEGFIFDKAKTIVPAKITNDEEASLSSEAKVTIDKSILKNGEFTSRLFYQLALTRAKFEYNKPKFVEMFIALGTKLAKGVEEIHNSTKSGQDDNELTVSDFTEILDETEDSISDNIEKETVKSTTAKIEITMELTSNEVGIEMKVKYKDTLKNIEFKKIHKYEPNLSESASAFEAKVAQQIK